MNAPPNHGLAEQFEANLTETLRRLDWAGAERLCREYLAIAERSKDTEAAAHIASSLATALNALDRREEALEALQLAEQYEPTESYRKGMVARQLISELNRPDEGLAKLAEAEPLLRPEERRAWLNEKALGLLAAGRDAEAVACFEEIASPKRLAVLRKLDHTFAVDFRVVAALIEKGLARDLCGAYLDVAEEVAARMTPPRLDIVHDLRNRLRGGA